MWVVTHIKGMTMRNDMAAKSGPGRLVDNKKKRTSEQREADLTLITRLLIREGMTSPEIAEKINSERPYQLSLPQIQYDVKELEKRWRDAYLSDMDILKGRELRRIDSLESAYWDSYERSLGSRSEIEENVTEFTKEGDKIGVADDEEVEALKRMRKSVTRKFANARDGEVRFLNGIQWCIDKRCEILGLNAPLKAEMTFDWRSEAEREGIDPGIIYNDIVKKFVNSNIVDGEMKELTDGN